MKICRDDGELVTFNRNTALDHPETVYTRKIEVEYNLYRKKNTRLMAYNIQFGI